MSDMMRYHISMRTGFFTLFFFLCALPVYAHTPYFVEQKSLHDVTAIENPEYSRAFYGMLAGFPHTYEIRTPEPFHLYVQVLVPDTETTENIINGIIIKETGKGGRVEEVARLTAKDASWESWHEPFGNDTYRIGGTFERDVAPGVYRIEVSTPDNLGKYVLAVGNLEGKDGIGYFETIGRLIEVKAFFGKSKIRIIESPLVYIPLLILGALTCLFYWRRIRRGNLQQK